LNAPKKTTPRTYHNPNPNAGKIAMHKENLRKIRNASLTPPHSKPNLNSSGIERDTSCGAGGGQYYNNKIEKLANNMAGERIRKQISKDGTNFYSKNTKLNTLKEPNFDENYNTKRTIHKRQKSRNSDYGAENYSNEATGNMPAMRPNQVEDPNHAGHHGGGDSSERYNNSEYYCKGGDFYESEEGSLEPDWNQQRIDDTTELKNQILEKKRRSRNVRNNNERGGSQRKS
jgi:hypothetical protein